MTGRNEVPEEWFTVEKLREAIANWDPKALVLVSLSSEDIEKLCPHDVGNRYPGTVGLRLMMRDTDIASSPVLTFVPDHRPYPKGE